jgi:glutamyl-tRNA reductase
VEFYLSTSRLEEALQEIRKNLNRRHSLKAAEVKKYFYFYEDAEAFRHLFRVAASLDSMVLGESQILGQVKEAYEQSVQAGSAGALTHAVFNRAFAAAKKIRSQTDIGRWPVGVPGVAVELAKKIFSSLRERRVLLMGAGEMGELTARYLVESGVSEFFVANRTVEKAKTLAHKLGAIPLTLEEGIEKIHEMDIILTSLGGETHLVEREEVEKAMGQRKGRSLFIIDTGVPRNVDPDAGKVDSVYLYNIDDLSSIAASHQGERLKAVEEAEALLEKEVSELCAWLNNRELAPTITRLRERFEKIRGDEWAEFSGRWKNLPEKEKKEMERLTKDIVAKLLHDPFVNLKKVEDEMDRFHFARMLDEIFGLSDDEK